MFPGVFRTCLPVTARTEPMRPQLDRRLRLEFHGAKLTSDAGLLACRELDDALDLTASAVTELQVTRTGRNSRHSLTALLRQSVYCRLAGYEELNDAARLRFDTAMRAAGASGRASGWPTAHRSDHGV